jgi:hypothetical protein
MAGKAPRLIEPVFEYTPLLREKGWDHFLV